VKLSETTDVLDMIDAVSKVREVEVEKLSPLVNRYFSQQFDVEHKESQLREAKKALERTVKVDLPAAMEAAGVEYVRMPDGTVIEVSDVLTARCRKGHEAELLEWLKSNGQEDMIRTEFSMSFGRGQYEFANHARGLLQDSKLHFEEKEGVPWNTLEKFVKLELAAGRDIPSAVNINEFRKVEVKK